MVVEWGNREGIERVGQQREKGGVGQERERKREGVGQERGGE